MAFCSDLMIILPRTRTISVLSVFYYLGLGAVASLSSCQNKKMVKITISDKLKFMIMLIDKNIVLC